MWHVFIRVYRLEIQSVMFVENGDFICISNNPCNMLLINPPTGWVRKEVRKKSSSYIVVSLVLRAVE